MDLERLREERDSRLALKAAKRKIEMADIFCPECKSKKISKNGFVILRAGRFQRFVCTKCGHIFTNRKEKGLRRRKPETRRFPSS
jgi:transposase-like protein